MHNKPKPLEPLNSKIEMYRMPSFFWTKYLNRTRPFFMILFSLFVLSPSSHKSRLNNFFKDTLKSLLPTHLKRTAAHKKMNAFVLIDLLPSILSSKSMILFENTQLTTKMKWKIC